MEHHPKCPNGTKPGSVSCICGMTIREALLSMSYFDRQPGVWMKPVGFHSFTFKEENNTWYNWFRNGLGEVVLYDSKELPAFAEDEHLLNYLKEWEAYTRISVDASRGSSFEMQRYDI